MLAQESLILASKADGVFEFASHSQYSGDRLLQKHRDRNKAARAPHLPQFSVAPVRDRVVTAAENVAIVDQQIVGEPSQALYSFLVVDGDRLFGQIAAGHHQVIKRSKGKEQMMH